METPILKHIKESDYEYVYEPAEDSFLMLDALEAEIDVISNSKPSICLEVGPGSGINITAFAKQFRDCLCIGADINSKACLISTETGKQNGVSIDCLNMDLTTGIKDNLIDVVIFNPPYVVTESLEVNDGRDICRAWAGGINGREVIDRFMTMLPKMLSVRGVCYMLVIEENIPEEIEEMAKGLGFKTKSVIKRKARNEKLQVLKFFR